MKDLLFYDTIAEQVKIMVMPGFWIAIDRDVAASLGGKLLALEAELEKADADNDPA